MTSKSSTPDSDGPKTETTLTTRIRINIPGSRPIPPVVVRKAMGSNSGPAGAEPEARPTAPQGPDPTPEAAYGPGRGSDPALGQRPKPVPTRIQAEAEPARDQGGAAKGEGPVGHWFAPRKAPAPAPAPAPTPPPAAAPAPGMGAGMRAGMGAAPAPGPGGGPAGPPAPVPGARVGGPQPPAPGARVGGPQPPVPGARVGGPQPPAGPGAGFAPPVHTSGPPAPDYGQGFAQPPAGPGAPRPGGPGVGATQGFPAYGPGQDHAGPATEAFPVYGTPAGGTPTGPAGPSGPTGGPGFGTGPLGAPHPDEAPRWPGPEVPGPGPDSVRPPVSDVPGPAPAAPRPTPAQQKATGKSAKKGRSKLVLLGGGLLALLGVAYGAGLLLNHSDVPKGTTVLDVDISGSRAEAVTKLQTAFGTRATAPLQLSVGGKQVELKPEKAGLSLDTQTTVRNAAGSDYNPVTVIGSLLGNERTADAVMPVDEEKLQVALQELAGTAGTATEATITFDTGKAVAVPGTPGTTLDVDASVDKVTKAFRDMVATGKPAVVELPVTTKTPAIDQAELDRAMKEFAEPAMSANAIVKIGTKSVPFGSKTLPKILSMQAVDGHLVEKFDLEALKEGYGNTFDGILITRGTGAKTAVTPQDVAGALGKALRGKTTAERTVVIDTNAG
ncbi:peptidoglycan binding domain-containing protein [Streptomyces sp. ISL-94]|uniref:peptidoglycan binding domain-containing protein n=1 Tax=Streptomyces sp. ISL-94 TaxID=2819190 RepID=UPI0027E4E23C|nr:peptidoglycan binding domain-containing protein [Streptomyces sp. ISL-94]